MEFITLFPEDLRQLVRFIPLRGFEVIEWRPLTLQLQKIAFHLLTSSGRKKVVTGLEDILPAEIKIAKIKDRKNFQDYPVSDRQIIGDQILRIYFSQFLNPVGMFLDLRSTHFSFEQPDLIWQPSNLWVQTSGNFRMGILAMYQAFYDDDRVAFSTALEMLGLLPENLAGKHKHELQQLLRNHFGTDQRLVTFNIQKFKETFDDLFKFFQAHDYKLPPDFLFLGFYLVTLYLVLEQLESSHDVGKICRECYALPDLRGDRRPASREPPGWMS